MAKESFRSAAECIGQLEPGMALFAVTRGQFSMIDAILACLEQTGSAAVTLWTWTVADYEVQCLKRLQQDERVTTGMMVIDEGARHKNKRVLADWQRSFGADSVRYVINHAKIATVTSADWRILLRGSFNLNFNPRFEQFDLTEGGPDYDLVREIEGSLPILADSSSCAEAHVASRLRDAWEPDELAMFQGIKPWAK